MRETLHNTLYTEQTAPQAQVQTLVYVCVPEKKEKTQVLSQSTYFITADRHTNAHSFASVRDCQMISTVISPDALLFLCVDDSYLNRPRRHTQILHILFTFDSLSIAPLSF